MSGGNQGAWPCAPTEMRGYVGKNLPPAFSDISGHLVTFPVAWPGYLGRAALKPAPTGVGLLRGQGRWGRCRKGFWGRFRVLPWKYGRERSCGVARGRCQFWLAKLEKGSGVNGWGFALWGPVFSQGSNRGVTRCSVRGELVKPQDGGPSTGSGRTVLSLLALRQAQGERFCPCWPFDRLRANGLTGYPSMQ